MKKEILTSEKIPKPVAKGYTTVTKAGNLLFLAGQLAVDAKTGQLRRSDIGSQARQVFQSIKTTLEACGSSMDNVLKITIYVKNLEDFSKVAEVRSEFFENSPPASTAVEVSRLFGGMDIEVDAIALIPS